MSKKVFNKKLPHRCEYCVFGTLSDFSNEVLCRKKGITSAHDSCGKYKYDPLKREPNRATVANNYKPEDFLL